MSSPYTLMVAGARAGKSSFLRLLIDTSVLAPTVNTEHRLSLAKFLHGSAAHTNNIRYTALDVLLDPESNVPTTLSLLDTPSIDWSDASSAERLVADIIRHIESRFADSVDEEGNLHSAGCHVHLCLYFLDPDQIVPPAAPTPPAPLHPRPPAGPYALQDPDPVILEPPVASKPPPPILPNVEIETIRRLSARVNVLPVIGRADTLSNERLAQVKMAVRKDLAAVGIGFGVFDLAQDNPYLHLLNGGDHSNGTRKPQNGGPNGVSPPASPSTPLLRLPYAIISPDLYSHSDGVPRIQPPRHEIINQYFPMHRQQHPASPLPKGVYVRSYRWGSLDVLDPNHNDFLPLRSAIFQQMETLQNYTREYLFDRYRADSVPARSTTSHHSLSHITSGPLSRNQLPPLTPSSRPILAIDTASSSSQSTTHPFSRSLGSGHPDSRPLAPSTQHLPESYVAKPSVNSNSSPTQHLNVISLSGASKQRSKKITVACNFCRSRKLKCDGGRPACGQCIKRAVSCDYISHSGRRRPRNNRKGEGTESDSEDDNSAEQDETSLSPEVKSQPLSRKSSNIERYKAEQMSIIAKHEHPDDMVYMKSARPSSSTGLRPETKPYYPDYELPSIVSLPPPTPASPLTPMSAPPASTQPSTSQSAPPRHRATTASGKPRQPSTTGPKVVACNNCRARKTKCDGAHPTCSGCLRRSLPCNYVHEGPGSGSRKGRRSSAPKLSENALDSSVHVQLNPSLPPHNVMHKGSHDHAHDLILKRSNNDIETYQGPHKKSRMDLGTPQSSVSGVA